MYFRNDIGILNVSNMAVKRDVFQFIVTGGPNLA
jgi:hypothetical protein